MREDRESGSSGWHASRGGRPLARPRRLARTDRAPVGAGIGPSVAADSLALGGGWLTQYNGGDEAAGAAVSDPILPGQALVFGFGSGEG
ncbi:hypothetical protein ACR6C2_19560 [Streptomyces sp. INA 01156]